MLNSCHGSWHTLQKREVVVVVVLVRWAGQALKPVVLFRQDETAAVVLDPCVALTKACQIHLLIPQGTVETCGEGKEYSPIKMYI